MPWSTKFDEPIAIEDGKRLRTLREAADHIVALPAPQTKLPHWQTAIACLLAAAEGKGPTMMARIGMLQALASGRPTEPAPAKKAKRYRIVG
jgi:hypothetical protein